LLLSNATLYRYIMELLLPVALKLFPSMVGLYKSKTVDPVA
jgi:hypothetical protein